MRRNSVSRIGVIALTAASFMTAGAGYATSASSAARSLTRTPAAVPERVTGVQHVRNVLRKPSLRTDAARRYKVRNGDTLSFIAQREYDNAGCWPGIYRANTGQISNPDLIYPGQQFQVPVACDARAIAQRTTITVSVQQAPAAAPAAPAPASAPVQASSSFQACVIERESGGNAQIWNASGHYGLYQFSYSTWVAAGGDGALFGRASAEYQTQIFWDAYRLWGTSPWAPYDGC